MDRQRKSSWISVLVVFLLKFGKIAKLTKLGKAFKALKATKLALTFGSMAISAFVYSFMWGPWFAVGFVIMLFIHEIGHVIAMRIKGIPVSAPVFIPMLGAVIFAPPFKDRETEAFVGYGGPLLGTIGAVISFGLWAVLPGESAFFLVLSYLALFLNLFNLIPIRPLDGGRITQVASRFFGILGGAIILVLPILLQNPGLLLLWILILPDIKIDPRFRMGAGAFSQMAMVTLMIGGYSDQGLGMDIVDCLLATAFNLIIFAMMMLERTKERTSLEAGRKELPPAPMSSRIKWSILYFLLAGVIIGLMACQLPYLPSEVRQ